MNRYSRPFSHILSLVAISALCCCLMAPSAAATGSSQTNPGTDFETSLDTNSLGLFEEAYQPEQPLLNVICDNPDLATVSYGSDEQYYCIWVTNEAGQRVDNLEVGDIYTVHLYLRASGPAGTSLKNLRIKWANEDDPIRIGIGCDVRYESTDGQKFYSSFNCLQLADSDIVKRPLVNTPVLLNSQEIDWSRLGGIAGGGDFPPVVIQELPVGRENAAEIAFQFRAEDIADYADYFARPNETSSSTDSTESLPSESPSDTPKPTSVIVKNADDLPSVFTESHQPDEPTLNSIRDNPYLAATSGASDEHHHCIWVTDETGQRVDALEAGSVYTAHLYLRASGPVDTSLKNLCIKWISVGDQATRSGLVCDVFHDLVEGHERCDTFCWYPDDEYDTVLRPLLGFPVLLNGQEIDPIAIDINPSREPIIQELPVGRENAAEITFQFRAEDADTDDDDTTLPNDTSDLTSPTDQSYTAADLDALKGRLTIGWLVGLVLALIFGFLGGILHERSRADTPSKTSKDTTPTSH